MRRWVRRLFIGGALVLGLVFAVFAFTAFRVWHVAREDHREPVDAIVVLGAAQFNGRPSQVFQARLDHARTLYLDHVAAVVVTVGGKQPGDVFTEAAAGAKYLREHQVDDVIEVGEGVDTLSSLEAAADVLLDRKLRRVVLVTDPWHSFRSRAIANDAGLRAQTSPARTGPVVQSRSTEVRYVLRETGGYLWYRIFGDRPHRRVPPAV